MTAPLDYAALEKMAREALEQDGKAIPAPWEWWNASGAVEAPGADPERKLEHGVEDLSRVVDDPDRPGECLSNDILLWMDTDNEFAGIDTAGGIKVHPDSARWIVSARTREPALARAVLALIEEVRKR